MSFVRIKTTFYVGQQTLTPLFQPKTALWFLVPTRQPRRHHWHFYWEEADMSQGFRTKKEAIEAKRELARRAKEKLS
ncbi:MAG: hypothetical protein E6Q97_13645 [Desulfurellales bacterium]|nr:MAG: hypothetical protein E6Q97_13645 [Desulfurellales bacterium]